MSQKSFLVITANQDYLRQKYLLRKTARFPMRDFCWVFLQMHVYCHIFHQCPAGSTYLEATHEYCGMYHSLNHSR